MPTQQQQVQGANTAGTQSSSGPTPPPDPTPASSNASAGGSGTGSNTVQQQQNSNNTSNNNTTQRTQTRRFTGKFPSLGVFLHKAENAKKDQFIQFTRNLVPHVLTEFDSPSDIMPVILRLEDPWDEFFTKRPDCDYVIRHHRLRTPLSPDDVDYVDRALKGEVESFTTRKTTLDDNLVKLYSVAWGQCSHAIQEEIKCEVDYRVKAAQQDGLWLLRVLQSLSSGVDRKAYQPLVTYQICRDFYNLRQHEHETADKYYMRFQNAAAVVTHLGADVAMHPNLWNLEPGGFIDADTSAENFYAVAFISNAYPKKYKALLLDLQNDMLLGNNNYPTTLQEAFELLGRWESQQPRPGSTTPSNNNNSSGGGGGRRRNRWGRRSDGEEVQLSQVNHEDDTEPPRPGYNGVTIPQAFCAPSQGGCGRQGHSFNYCPDRENNTNVSLQAVDSPMPDSQHIAIEDICSSLVKGDLLLDSGSTNNSIKDDSLLEEIIHIPSVTTFTNTGSGTCTQQGNVKRFPGMIANYKPNGLANILSLAWFWKHPDYRVFCNSDEADSIFIETPTEVFQFDFVAEGLFILNNKPKATVKMYSVSFLDTVADLKKFFSSRQVDRADKARILRHRIGYPGKTTFRRILRGNEIINCPVTVEDFDRSLYIYGEQVPRFKGAMTRPKSKPSTRHPFTNIDPDWLRFHQDEELEIDFIHVEGECFFHTYSKNIQCTHVTHLSSRQARMYIPVAKLHRKYYTKRGFNITRFHADPEFEPLRPHILPSVLETCGRDEHVKGVERNSCSLKERCRSTYHSVPYKRIPRLMIKSLVSGSTRWMNKFTKLNGISRQMSPDSIVLGHSKVDYNTINASYGEYCIIYKYTSNDNSERAEHGIALEPADENGNWHFMTLPGGKKIKGWEWDSLPITDHVIQMVEDLATTEGKTDMPDGFPRFELEPGVDWNDEERVNDYHSDSDDSSYHPITGDPKNDDIRFYGFDDHLPEVSPDDLRELEIEEAGENVHENNTNTDEATEVIQPVEEPTLDEDEVNESDLDIEVDSVDSRELDPNNFSDIKDEITDEIDNILQLEENLQSEVIEQSMDSPPDNSTTEDIAEVRSVSSSQSETRSASNSQNSNDATTEEENHTHGGLARDRLSIGLSPALILPEALKRITKPNSKFAENLEIQLAEVFQTKYKQQQDEREKKVLEQKLMYDPETEDFKTRCFHSIVDILLAQHEQMHASKGLKVFGDEAVAALVKEYKQLISMKVFSKVEQVKLTKELKEKALNSINLIKQKRDMSVKGRCVGDGRAQRRYINKEEASSPTLSTEALFLSLMIDASEDRDIAIFDIPGAYLHADMPKHRPILLKFKNEFVDMVCDADPSFLDTVHYEGKTKVLYVKLDKALYGCMESGLMWYNLYTQVLEQEGFTLNPYDRCVANKIINGKQCTITFYVDDNKISHVDSQVVDDILEKIKKKFGAITIQRGKDLDFLGMIINKTKDGVTINMQSYIQQVIESFNETDNVNSGAATPARKNLFTTITKDIELSQKKADKFHSLVAKLLWVSKRGRPDIEIAIAYLCTRVSCPTDRDWRKLKRVIQFLYCTIDNIRVISANDISKMFDYVDASYAVHPNLRSHTGGAISFGKGVVHQWSTKQKLNTKSSTEAEVIGLSD